jgi:predicted transcriptional regulator
MWEINSHNIYKNMDFRNIMIEELKDTLNLDDKEAKIFIALHKRSKASINDLLKYTKIERRTIYDVLERLIQKGYVNYITENNHKIYSPLDINSIREDLNQKTKKFESIIPSLKKIMPEEELGAGIFTGKKGITSIFNEIISLKETHYAFGDVSKFVENTGFDTQRFLNSLKELKLSEKIIYPEGKKVLKIPRGEYRVLDTSVVPPTPVIIYGNITAIFLFSEPVTIIRIENKEFTESYKKYFQHYWNIGKKI